MLKMPYSQMTLALAAILASQLALAGFSSGSTGVDGALSPTADVTIQLPESGVLNYTTVNIPAGVTVKFAPNSANTAVTMLTTGDVNIAGTVSLDGESAKTTGVGVPVYSAPKGGPGGYPGGLGGLPGSNTHAGSGYGPGGGLGGIDYSTECYGTATAQGGGGGGYSAPGANSLCVQSQGYNSVSKTGKGGDAYGSRDMLPLVGGSGGGGGGGSLTSTGNPGTNGGAGGGALLLAATGNVILSGKISARGGQGGNPNGGACWNGTGSWTPQFAGAGGGGAGGAIRVLTPSFSGSGVMDVSGGVGGCMSGNTTTSSTTGYLNSYASGGNGAAGFSGVEIVTSGTFDQTVIPTLKITKIGGVTVPNSVNGAGSITLPIDLPNPASVEVAATGIPVGTAVKLTVNPPYADKYSANTAALAGTTALSTATGSINIPTGASTIYASTTYSLTLAQGDALSTYAMGERVKEVELIASLGGKTLARLTTVSGKQFDVSPAVLAVLGKERA